MPQTYYTIADIQLQPEAVQGPATITMTDLADAWSSLIPIDTLADKKVWATKPYDFPFPYVNLGPLPVVAQDPMSTYAADQNNRFVQRYITK
jgi:hypothetical protein